MALSNDLISQFAKITKDDKKKNSEQTVYGTVVDYNGEKYLKIDGSDLLTPISSTTRANNDERVTAMIKNHTVTVTGNLTSPAARSGDVETIGSKITEFEVAIGDKVDTKELNAQTARIDELYATDVTIKNSLTANAADIKDLQADNATIKGTLTANSADITNLKAENASITGRVTANEANIGTLQTDTANITSKLTAAEADIGELEADNATIHGTLDAHKGYIDDLEATKLSAESADIKYANIDFSNIGKAAMEYFYANSGLIKNVVVGDQTITGNLVGVTISGDLIEGNTIVAEKLVIKGDDGLYYKLNTDGVTTEAEQTDYNSINGSVIRAKTITATQISVSDLVAFGATIGGYNITDSSLYSGVKETVGNTTRGVYLDNDGQFAVGDASNYLKFFQDTDGTYKLEVSASSVKFSSSGKSVEQAVNDAIVSTVEQFYLSTSSAGLSGGSWSTEQPTWEEGKYIWRRTLVTYGNGTGEYTPSAQGVCITGNTGAKGDTGATGKGVKSNTRYYCLQASATKPSKPTTNPPDSKWTTTEPSYTTGSTSYLYTVDLTVYTDNNFLYSDVSLSSSYEAAKAAYAKAVNAETEISKTNEEVALKASKNEVTETLKGYATTASMNAAITTKANEITSSVAANYTTKTEFDSLQIGGTNLLRDTATGKGWGSVQGAFSSSDGEFTISTSSTTETYFYNNKNLCSLVNGETYTLSAYCKSNGYVYSMEFVMYDTSLKGVQSKCWSGSELTSAYKKFVWTFTVPDDGVDYSQTVIRFDNNGSTVEGTKAILYIKDPKLEHGNKATDWSPAPEDIESRVASAETRITQTETDIKSKASQTELTGLTTRVSTAEQNIDAANTKIESKVSKTEFDSLQIGGRNLLKGAHSSAVSYTYPSSSYTDGWARTSTVPLNGGTYTLSFWAKSTVNGDRARVHFFSPSNITSVTGSQGQKGTAADGLCDFVLSTTLTKYWVIYTIPESGESTRTVILPRLGQGYGTGTVTVKWEKLEEGNKATDWSPAPEDIESRVASAETRITQNETSINSKASKTELTDLTTRVNTAEQDIDAANASISLKVSQVDFDNLQIGGTNLLRNTATGEGWSYGAFLPSTREFVRTTTTASECFIYPGHTVSLVNGETYTLSAYIKTNGYVGSIEFQVVDPGYAGIMSKIWWASEIPSVFKKFVFTFTVPNNGVNYSTTHIRFDNNGSTVEGTEATLYIKDPKLEHGNKATDWSPAPEDAATSVKTTTVTIDTNGMNVSTGGTVEFNTNKFEITPPDGGDQLFSVNASTKNLTAQNGYFTYLFAPNMASRPATTDVIARNIGSGSGYYPSIQAAWDSLPDVCGYVVFNVRSDSPGSASLRNKYVSCLIIQSSPSTSKFNIGTVEFLGLSGTISNVTMSCNGGMYDDACKIIGSNFAFANVAFASSGRGLSIFYGGYACLSDCQISGIGNYAKPQNYAICVANGFLSCNNTYGLGTAGGVYGQAGSLIALNGTCPGPSVVATGATVVGNYTVDGAVIDVPVVEQSSTFTASTWCTWECISGSLWKRITVNVSVQSRSWSGLNNKNQYPNGFCKRAGWWVLDTGTSIKDTLSGKTISKATVIINRTNTGEAYKLNLAYHGVTDCNLNGYSVSADYNIANQLKSIGVYDISADSGQVIITLPSSLYSKLQDGTIKGFGLLNNGTYFKDVYCDGTCTLNVTYT